MIDEEIVSYLIEGQRRGHSFDILKNNLLNGGFDEEDINEAFRVANQRIGLSQNFDEDNGSGLAGQNMEEYRGVKWMKIAGIIGLFYIIFSVLYLIITFIPTFSEIMKSLSKSPFIYILYGVVFTSTFFYYSGFIRLGRRAGSKFISFYGWTMIIIPILVILFVVFAWSYVNLSLGSSLSPGMDGVFSNDNGSSNSVLVWVFLVIYIILILFYLTVQILFCVGLIKIGDKIRFSKIAGILNLITMIISIATIVTLVVLILLNPLFIMSLMLAFLTGSYPGIFIAFIITAVVIYVLGLSATLLVSLTLLDASKKYEA